MKLRISNGKPNSLSGFVNVDNSADPADNTKVSAASLDEICDNGEAEELVLDEVLQYISFAELPAAIGKWLRKLMSGGPVSVTFRDFDVAANNYHLGNISLQQLNDEVYGPRHAYKSVINTAYVISLLKANGVVVSKVNASGIVGTKS